MVYIGMSAAAERGMVIYSSNQITITAVFLATSSRVVYCVMPTEHIYHIGIGFRDEVWIMVGTLELRICSKTVPSAHS